MLSRFVIVSATVVWFLLLTPATALACLPVHPSFKQAVRGAEAIAVVTLIPDTSTAGVAPVPPSRFSWLLGAGLFGGLVALRAATRRLRRAQIGWVPDSQTRIVRMLLNSSIPNPPSSRP